MKFYNGYIKIDTKNTSLILYNDAGLLKKIYYGSRLNDGEDFSVLHQYDCTDSFTRKTVNSSFGEYDFRESFVLVQNGGKSFTNRFIFQGHRIFPGKPVIEGLPSSHGGKETVELLFKERDTDLVLKQYLTVFDDCDVIAAGSIIENNTDAAVDVCRLMSLQLDLDGVDYELLTFDGSWARERLMSRHGLKCGIHITDSKCGASSSYHNPFIMLNGKNTAGGCYGFNLVYSGNHKEIVEISPFNLTRVLVGMNDFMFNWRLEPGKAFQAPEAVMAYGADEQAVTSQMHRFVNNHIIRGKHAKKPRPVVFNNWEATYFNFTYDKLLALADIAKDLGLELFVLDDGWFGKRNGEDCSMGDWYANIEKLPKGLAGLAAEIRKRGMEFGFWVEPEMVSEDSELYRRHPEYAMRIPGRSPWLQRSELMLDYMNPEVRDYIVNVLSEAIESCDAKYIKWDFNRLMTDVYSPNGAAATEYFHRYVLGLYAVLDRLTKKFPEVLFEGCASGGARYDLGMLCFMPQIWTSDNTEACDRIFIQEGTLYGYPQSTMSAHMSICPNHQNKKSTSIENRFNVAAAGVFGFEMDFTECCKDDLDAMRRHVEFYKAHRELLTYGMYHKLYSAFSGDYAGWIVVSEDRQEAIATIAVIHSKTNFPYYRFGFTGLDPAIRYRVEMRNQSNVGRFEPFVAWGDLLNEKVMNFGDIFDVTDREKHSDSIATRMFYIRKDD